MDKAALTADKVSCILHAEGFSSADKVVFTKQRTLKIYKENICLYCKFDIKISFHKIHKDGSAFNQAEIILLPEEFPAFTFTLQEHPIPFPSVYRQWLKVRPYIITIYLESVEAPESFAERLASALNVIDN